MNARAIGVDGEAGARISGLARSRLIIALSLTAVMVAVYFGFMGLFAFDKPTLGTIIAPGLSLGILLGPLVILCSFFLCLAYVVWANVYLDPGIDAIKR